MAKCFSDLFSSTNIEIISSTNIKINQTIEEGVVVVGVVKVITKYGAFVNLGSVDGLIHKKDISWGNIKNSLDSLNVGDKVTAKIIKHDIEKNKISLSIKHLTPHPWEGLNVVAVYPVDSKQVGIISNIVDYGLFVDLGKGIEGLVHKSEISYDRGLPSVSELFHIGQQIEVVVLNIDTDARRMSLSLKQALGDPWRGANSKYAPGKVFNGKINNVTDFGIFVCMEQGIEGLIRINELSLNEGDSIYNAFSSQDKITVEVLNVNENERRMALKII